MEPGFIIDEGYGQRTIQHWYEEEPETSFWTGIKLGDRAKLQVATYRCRSCGFLESYA
jgi:hypothetical protein